MFPINNEKQQESQLQRQRIHRIYLLLTCKLPPELTPSLISHADLYDHRKISSTDYNTIRITNSPKVLLQTPP